MEPSREKEISNLKWGYVILLSKFVLNMWSGIPKSLGVLFYEMVEGFDVNYATLGFVCSFPSALMLFSGPFVSLILWRVDHRLAAVIGGSTSAVCLVLCGFVRNIPAFGILLALTGSRAFVYLPITILLNEYFKENFVLINTLSSFGKTTGIIFLPIIAERSMEAYGYHGVFMILGGIMSHTVAAAAAIRKPIFKIKENITVRGENDSNTSKMINKEQSEHDNEEVGLTLEGCERATTHGSRKDLFKAVRERNFYNKENPEIAQKPIRMSKDMNYEENYEKQEVIPRDTDDNDEDSVPLIGSTGGHPNELLGPSNASKSLTDEHEKHTFCSLMSRCKLFIIKEILFVMCLPAVFCHTYSIEAWMLFLVPHAEDLGIHPSTAVLLSFIGGIGGIFGRITAVILLAKKVHMFKIYILVGFINSWTFFLDFVGESFLIRSAWAFIQGLCFFINETVASNFMKLTLKDESNFSFALGLAMLVKGFGCVSAGTLTGALLDANQSYVKVFMLNGISIILFIINTAIVMVILRKRVES